MDDTPLKSRWWHRLIKLLNSIDGIIVFAGLLGLAGVVLVENIVVRLICFAIVVGSAVLSFASMQSKRAALRQSFRVVQPSVSPLEERKSTKKLVYDDFQINNHGTPVFEEHNATQLQDSAVAMVSAEDRNIGREKNSTTRKPPDASQDFQLSDFFDLDSDLFRSSLKDTGQPELRNEFDFLLNKVLAVIKEVVFAHTVALFWANHDKQQMVCEAKVTESTSFLPSHRFLMGDDIVSQIAHRGKPELISRVNPSSEKELLRYYERPEFIKSFVGVPVFYPAVPKEQTPSQPVGVIVVDSTAEDAFGHETISLLGQFTKLISALIKTSTDKYDLLLDAELLSAIRRLQERIRNDFSTQTIAQTLSDETGKLLNWSFLSVVLYDEVKRGWAAKKVVSRNQESYIGPEQLIDLDESIVGNAIKHNTHQLVQDLETERLPRYYRGEKVGGSGAFVSVPISSLNKCYGALNIESGDKFNFSRKDIEIMYRLAENAASALEILYMNDIIAEYVIVDDLTGVYSKKFFMKKLHEELLRAEDYGTELSLLLVTIDHANRLSERYGQDGFERVLMDVAKMLRSGVRPYDTIGRYDFNRFAAILVNTTANDAFIWAEKVRKTVASHIVTIHGKSFSATVSIGVCGALEGMKKEEILDHAIAVLRKGLESGGNAVRVY